MVTYSRPLNSNDIAHRAGVSQTTVSRVLSGSKLVKPATRDRVLRVIKESNYQPNAIARAMKTKLNFTVGAVVSRITNPVVPEILMRLANKLAANNRRMIVWNTDTEGEEGVISAIRQNVVDGLIFTAAGHQSVAMEEALNVGMPIASINRHVEGAHCDQIVGANEEGARLLTQYLIDAGKTRIAVINGPLDRSTLADRESGMRGALKDNGLDLPPSFYSSAQFEHEAFRARAIDMMALSEPPEVILCGNDVIAFAVLCGLKAAGCSVPDDVWVAGFDGIEMAGWDVYDLTTMKLPLDEMTSVAVETLIDRIEGRGTNPRMIRFDTHLTVRGSTANTPFKPKTN